jgi:hypothetical protein
MIEIQEPLTNHIHAPSGLRWLRYGWSALTGGTLGLALARLLYESDPFTFMAFGSLLPGLALVLAGGLIWLALIWGADLRAGSSPALPESTFVPMLLMWLYILTPPMQVDPLRGVALIGGSLLLSLALAGPWLIAPGAEIPANRRWVGTIGIGIIALGIYLLTLQRTIGGADTFEFQVTAPVLGVAHPTGYPLYILIGKVFSLIPIGKVATRVNLTSAVAAAVAVMFVFLTLRRVFYLDRFISGLSALAFGLSPIFWSQAVVAEVYALHNAFFAAILGAALWLVVRYRRGVLVEDQAVHVLLRDSDSPYPGRIVIVMFALIGLSLTNHLTTVLLLPAVALSLILAWPRLSARQWTLAVGLMLAALLIYLYIPLRWPALHDGRAMRPDEFWGWVTGSRFRGALQLQAWLQDPERWRILGRLIFDQYGWLGVILGLIGFVLMVVRQWRAALVSTAVFAAIAFYGLNYLIPDIGVFLIPLFMLQAMWMGYGVAVMIDWVFRRYSLRIETWVHAALITLFALLPLRAAWITGATFDWSDELALEAWGRRVLDLPLTEDSAILADSEKIAPLEYLHRIEGIRPDMDMVVLGTEADYFDDLNARLSEGQTVYLARFLPGLEGPYSLRSVGPLIEVGSQPLIDAPDNINHPAEWVNGIMMLGAEIQNDRARPGDEVWITLYWHADEVPSNNVQVRVRLVDQGGQAFWQNLPAYPVGNRYPPVAWKSNEIVPDFHPIPLPYTLHPGAYTIEVSLAAPFSQDIATLVDGTEWAQVASLEVLAPDDPLPITGTQMAITFPQGALVGVEAQAVLGESRLIATWLSGRTDIQTEYSVPQNEGSADYPVITQASELRVRGEVDGEEIKWEIGGAPVRCGWMQPLSDLCYLASTPARSDVSAQSVANFDNKLLLTEVIFKVGRLQPGQNVDVTLVWQALAPMDEDYTIFVHLLGPDGHLHGQVDAWPVQGTFPTSTWGQGETIEDRYLVLLDPDAPAGSYQLEIGVYLLATNTRLPVINGEGLPVDDHVLLGGLIVPE